MAKKLSQSKARKILHDKSVHGHPLTDKQRKFFGAVASGYIKAQNGIEGTMGGLTDKGFNYNGAWGGPSMKTGGWLDKYQTDEIPNAQVGKKLRRIEKKIERKLEGPMTIGTGLAHTAVNKKKAKELDTLRHAYSSMETSKAIQDATGNIPIISDALGLVGTNALGIGHELTTLLNSNTDFTEVKESGEDLINNFVGSVAASIPFISDKKKRQAIQYLSDKGLLPDGTTAGRGREYVGGVKYQTGGNIQPPMAGAIQTVPMAQEGKKINEDDFQKFFQTLPSNLRVDSPDYNLRGYWDALGRPAAFDYSQPKEDDGAYHGFSRHPETGEILKRPQHPTFKMAIEEDRKAGYFPIVTPEGKVKTITGKLAMGGPLPGSVGFMYARTQSPAPSNGPYAKKTKASAQQGKEVASAPTVNLLEKIAPKSFLTAYGQGESPYSDVILYNLGAYGEKRISPKVSLSGNINSGSAFYPGGKKLLMKPTYNVGVKYNFENGGNMSYYQHGLDWKPKTISKEGSVIKDDRGQWAHPGEITEIGSNRITMKGVNYPVLGVSDEGDTQLMQPGGEYKFKGKKVTEYPMKNGGWLNKYK